MALVVVVAQRKGGAGKSTVAANLATAAAVAGRRIALLDTDPQKSLVRWHAARLARGPGAAPLTFEDPSGWRVTGALDRLRRTHDLIVVDTPPHADSDARVAIRAADLVLLPLQPSPADVWAMDATLDFAKAERRPVLVLMNRVPAQGRLREVVTAAMAERGLTLLPATLGNRTAFAVAFAAGLGVVEAQPRSAAADEVRALLAAVLDRPAP